VCSTNILENIAWSYASSVWSYEIFGDAVVFDTTHRLNAFDMSVGMGASKQLWSALFLRLCASERGECPVFFMGIVR